MEAEAVTVGTECSAADLMLGDTALGCTIDKDVPNRAEQGDAVKWPKMHTVARTTLVWGGGAGLTPNFYGPSAIRHEAKNPSLLSLGSCCLLSVLSKNKVALNPCFMVKS